jgi:uncharacterized membrane protein
MSSLIFVYALDGGLFNGITHYAHKIVSPSTYGCNLCAVTNNMLGTKREWANFIRELGIKTEFLHRDEFKQAYPKAQQDNLPAVFRSTGDSDLEVLITGTEINACHDLSALISLVRDRVKTSQKVAAHASASK